MKKYDLAVYIGRFQPFHKGHEYVIDEAFKIADKVLVLVGSAYASRSIKNPFTYEERKSMLDNYLINKEALVFPLADYIYEENQWLTEVQDKIVDRNFNETHKICMIGHDKDDTSYYINSFPQWDTVKLDHWETVNATDIRDLYFSSKSNYMWKSAVSEGETSSKPSAPTPK